MLSQRRRRTMCGTSTPTQGRVMTQVLATRSSRLELDDYPLSLVPVDAIDVEPGSGADVIGVLVAYGDSFARTGLRAVLNTNPDIAVVGCAADGDQAVAM